MSDFRVLVTGARTTTPRDDAVVIACLKRVCEPALRNGRPVVIIEGECPTGGVDVTARQWASIMPGVAVEKYPAEWHRLGKAAGPTRNQAMVDSGADICLAFPGPDSVGTWDCLKRAARAGIPGRVYPIGAAA
jgi:hypothetical protein